MIVHAAGGSGQWLGVDWGSILLVAIVALVATVVVVGSYSLGVRLLSVGAPDIEMADGDDPEGSAAVVHTRTQARPMAATLGAGVCFAIGIVATLYGIYLVVPLFHMG
ncbi:MULTISPECIES: hypothetical protein [unclassified Microbacterium]|uniref:hypothetical protein n=1 Tax=unclassified Microbacterium TaxID=2609290 RepID=UPI0037477182